MEKIGIIGAGSWGTALSKVVADNGHEVTVWSIVESEIEMLKAEHEHKDKLPGVKLPEQIVYTTRPHRLLLLTRQPVYLPKRFSDYACRHYGLAEIPGALWDSF